MGSVTVVVKPPRALHQYSLMSMQCVVAHPRTRATASSYSFTTLINFSSVLI